MKRVLSLLLILLLIAAVCLPAAAAGYSAQVSAASAILYNTDTAEVLYAKNASGPVLPGGSAVISLLQADRVYSQMAILSSGAMYMLSPSLIPKVSKKLSFCMTLTLTR